MNKKNLLDDIVALPENQQEEVVLYVSSLKKKNAVDRLNDVILLELLMDDAVDFTEHLGDYALQSQTIGELRGLFDDAPDADELCAMLTK